MLKNEPRPLMIVCVSTYGSLSNSSIKEVTGTSNRRYIMTKQTILK